MKKLPIISFFIRKYEDYQRKKKFKKKVRRIKKERPVCL